MSKGDNRLKILYVLDELKNNSNHKKSDSEDRFLSATELIDTLSEKYALSADRKSVYSYIESLIKFGYDIEKSRRGYYLCRHYNKAEDEASFELPELKMIVDALSASRFISAKKTKSIIHKLENLTDDDGNQLTQRKIYLEKAIKSDNSSVIYSIDAIYTAILQNRQISFKYQKICIDFDSGNDKLVAVNKKSEDNKDKLYQQSPFALVWQNEFYYLICFDSETMATKTFRVDKMKDVTVCNDIKRVGNKEFSKINISEYANTAFSMFGGETVNVVLKVRKSLAGVIADRFGKKISVYHDDDDDFFRCSVNVQKSPQFYSWLSGFGGDIELIVPQSIRADYINYIEGLLMSYQKGSSVTNSTSE